MSDDATLTYAESLRQVTAAFAAVQAQGLVGLHAPEGAITVSWGEWVSNAVVDVGGFGRGVDGQGWAEWLACCPPVTHPWLEALRADIVARGICCSGPDHQHNMCPSMRDEGHPDLVVHATFSNRGWGGMIAAIWNSENPENKCSYCDFAFLVFEGPLRADGTRLKVDADVLNAAYPIEAVDAELREAGVDVEDIQKRGTDLVADLMARRAAGEVK